MHEHDNEDGKKKYFEKRDKLIKTLPEPEKSVFQFFRMTEKKHMLEHGKLIVDGISPIEKTAKHFSMDVEQTRKICLNALNKLNNMMKKY